MINFVSQVDVINVREIKADESKTVSLNYQNYNVHICPLCFRNGENSVTNMTK